MEEKQNDLLREVNNLIKAKSFNDDFIANGEIRSIKPITAEEAQRALVEVGEICKKYKIYSLVFSLIKKF